MTPSPYCENEDLNAFVVPHQPHWYFVCGGFAFGRLDDAEAHHRASGEPIYCRLRPEKEDRK